MSAKVGLALYKEASGCALLIWPHRPPRSGELSRWFGEAQGTDQNGWRWGRFAVVHPAGNSDLAEA
jgi:hypothetical protein